MTAAAAPAAVALPARTTAADIMTRALVTVRDDAPLADVVAKFAESGVSGAPVVDENGYLVGVLSERDLIAQVQHHAAAPRRTMINFGVGTLPPPVLQKLVQDGLSGLRARDVMSRPAVYSGEWAPLETLADLMLSRRVNRVPIVRGGKPVGIVSREDVLRALAALLAPANKNNQEEPPPR